MQLLDREKIVQEWANSSFLVSVGCCAYKTSLVGIILLSIKLDNFVPSISLVGTNILPLRDWILLYFFFHNLQLGAAGVRTANLPSAHQPGHLSVNIYVATAEHSLGHGIMSPYLSMASLRPNLSFSIDSWYLLSPMKLAITQKSFFSKYKKHSSLKQHMQKNCLY